MSAQNTVYLNLREITELHKPDIQVKDVAEVYCSDAHVQNRCASLKIKTIREQKRKRYVENALNVIRILEGNTCGTRQTACADQLTRALREAAQQ